MLLISTALLLFLSSSPCRGHGTARGRQNQFASAHCLLWDLNSSSADRIRTGRRAHQELTAIATSSDIVDNDRKAETDWKKRKSHSGWRQTHAMGNENDVEDAIQDPNSFVVTRRNTTAEWYWKIGRQEIDWNVNLQLLSLSSVELLLILVSLVPLLVLELTWSALPGSI